MAQRITARNKVVLSPCASIRSIREVVRTYVKNLGVEVVEVGFGPDGRVDRDALGSLVDDKTAAVVFQSPNFFGVVEDAKALSDAAHGVKALCGGRRRRGRLARSARSAGQARVPTSSRARPNRSASP